jgi:hypothetical protein
MKTKLKKGLENPKKAIRHAYKMGIRRGRDCVVYSTSRKPVGVNVLKEDVDMVVILDACRVDIMKKCQPEYEFINNVDSVWSIGGTSPEWMMNTFTETHREKISNTGYITANPHSRSVFENRLAEHFRGKSGYNRDITSLNKYGSSNYVSADEIGHYYPVWAEQDPNEKDYYDLYGSPRKLTDRAIHTDRNRDLDCLIVHYMPPHQPYIINALEEDREPELHEMSPWEYIRQTNDKESVKKVCTDMLRWGLDEVKLLLKNTDRKNVVITADHGDAFGEFGVFSHHAGSLHPYIRKVPWIETTARDNHTYDPEIENKEPRKKSAEERLQALGYL